MVFAIFHHSRLPIPYEEFKRTLLSMMALEIRSLMSFIRSFWVLVTLALIFNKYLISGLIQEGSRDDIFTVLKGIHKFISYHEKHLKIAIEIGDRAREGRAYANLGIAYLSLGDFRKALEYHEKYLKIAIEISGQAGEGGAYGNLSNGYHSLSDFQKAFQYHEKHLKITIEIGHRAGERRAYGNLGNAYFSRGDFRKAIEYIKNA